MKTAILAALALAVTLGGCETVRNARDRIVRAPPACEDVTIPIYFEPSRATLTAEGRRILALEAQRAKRCRIDSVRVLGLADATGEPAANLELSQQRAAAVTDAIMKAGLPPAEFDLTAAGQTGSVTADGAIQPVRRRAEVTLKLSPPK